MDKFSRNTIGQETQQAINSLETLPQLAITHSPQSKAEYGQKDGKLSIIGGQNMMLRHSMQVPTGSLKREQEELDIMRKQLRAEKAEFTKKQAIIEQQNEILTLQLAEAQKREKIQQDMSDRVIQALRAQVAEAQNRSTDQVELAIEEDHPKVQELVSIRLQSMQERLHKLYEQNQHQVYNVEKELSRTQYEAQNLQKELDQRKRDNEQQIRHFESKIQRIEHEKNSQLRDLKQSHQERTRDLEHEVEVLQSEQKKKQSKLINSQIEETSILNVKFTKLQRQHQETLTQLKQAFIDIEGLADTKNQLAKDLESNQQDVVDLENALQEIQIQHQIHEQAARVEQLQLQEEITRLVQANLHQNNTLLKLEGAGNRTSTTTLSLNHRDRKTSSSSRNKHYIAANIGRESVQQDASYTRFSREDFEVLNSEIGHEGDDDDYMNKCSRLVSHYRSLSKRLEVQFKDLKDRYKKDVGKLQNLIQLEKKRRTQLFEDKIDRTSQLMKELVEKDNQIINLQAQLSQVRSNIIDKKYSVPQDEETMVSAKKMVQSRVEIKKSNIQSRKQSSINDLPNKVDIQKKKEESPDENFDSNEGNDRNQGLAYIFFTHRGSRNVEQTVSEVIPSLSSKIQQDFSQIIQPPYKIFVQDDDQSVDSSAQKSPRNEYYQLSRNLNQPPEYQDEKKAIDGLQNSIVNIALLQNQIPMSSVNSSFEDKKDTQKDFEDSEPEPYTQLLTLNSHIARASRKQSGPQRTQSLKRGDDGPHLPSSNQKVAIKKRPPLCSPSAQKSVQTQMLFKTTLVNPSPTYLKTPKKLIPSSRSTSSIKKQTPKVQKQI